jgi:anti-anti-sigma factor
MSPPLTWIADEQDGVALLTVHGELSLAVTANLRTTLMKCLAEQPDALLVDLSGMSVVDSTALAVFTAVVRQAAMWPGIPVLLCEPQRATAALLAGGGFGRLQVHRSLTEAYRVIEAGTAGPPALVDQLLPIAGTARHARNMATEACTRWSLPELIGPAALVASELVTNAIEHAGTMMTLRISRRPRYVHLAVKDGSVREPALTRPVEAVSGGRGLLLVDSVAVHWGWLPCRDGKVVWAALAARS